MSFATGAGATVNLLGNNDSLRGTLSQSSTMLTRWGSSTQKNMGAIFKIAMWTALGIGVALVTKAIVNFMRASIDTAKELQLELSKLQEVLNNTGNTARLTNNDILALANTLQKKTTFGRLQGVQALNELSRIAGVTREEISLLLMASADMAAFWNRDLKTTARDLALALNNPFLGIRRLRNVFVPTTEMNEMIKQAEKTNDVLKARAVVMQMVAQIQGVAAAKAKTVIGQEIQARNKLTEAYQKFGETLLPVWVGMVKIAATLAEGMLKLANSFSANIGPIIDSVLAVNRLASAVNNFTSSVKTAESTWGKFLADQYTDLVKWLALWETWQMTQNWNPKGFFGISEALEKWPDAIRQIDAEVRRAERERLAELGLKPGKPFSGFGDDKVEKTLTGKFESLERTWKRITEAAQKDGMKDATEDNTEATKRNTEALKALMNRNFKNPQVVGAIRESRGEGPNHPDVVQLSDAPPTFSGNLRASPRKPKPSTIWSRGIGRNYFGWSAPLPLIY